MSLFYVYPYPSTDSSVYIVLPFEENSLLPVLKIQITVSYVAKSIYAYQRGRMVSMASIAHLAYRTRSFLPFNQISCYHTLVNSSSWYPLGSGLFHHFFLPFHSIVAYEMEARKGLYTRKMGSGTRVRG